MEMAEGVPRPVVQEYVLNTYTRFKDYPVKAADDYWSATRDYWAAVRNEWDQAARKNGGIRIKEQADTGTIIAARLLEMGTAIADGTMKQAAAVAEARELIRSNS